MSFGACKYKLYRIDRYIMDMREASVLGKKNWPRSEGDFLSFKSSVSWNNARHLSDREDENN